MRFAVAVLACALAVANAQLNRYSSFGNQYQGLNQGQYRPGQYNPYQPLKKFNQPTYKPYVTPAPARATASVSVTPAPFVSSVPVPVVKPVAVSPAVVAAAKAVTDERSAETVRYGNEINPDGTFNYYYETNNGIAAQAQGTPRNFGGNPPLIPDVIQGSFSWYSPEGVPIGVTYVADENGYQPQSDALPVPPALPPQIARALEYINQKYKN